MNSIPVNILENVEKIIKRYSLFTKKEVCILYSGGKDSLFLCLALRELGYQVFPIIIDIGYNSDWTIALENMKKIGVKCRLIESEKINRFMPDIKEELKKNLLNIERIKKGYFKKATICTPCYNSKMIVMKKWAEINGIDTVASGHHGTDSITSLLKSYYMYFDRWECQHIEYTYENFNKLVSSQKKWFMLEEDEFKKLSLCTEIKKQIEAQNIGTDEPILQYLGNSNIRLCRPLFNVFESEIIQYFQTKKFIFNESECFITNYRDKNRATPREMIQYELLQNAPKSLLLYLLELTKINMDEHGFLKYNVRNNRAQILGANYKDEKINIIKE